MKHVSPEILKQIKAYAARSWPDNPEMRDYTVETECVSYAEFVALDFDAAESVREAIVTMAEDYSASWEERTVFCEDQIAAYKELQSIDLSGLPDDFVKKLRRRAEEESDGDFEQKLDFINKSIKQRKEIERIRAEIAPIRDLLIQMEKIIGNECYNGNIQIYGPFGEGQGEGRSFRYPVTFIKNGEEFNWRKTVPNEFPDEALITGQYKFGANKLSIFRALVKVVRMLEEEYGLKATKP